MPVIRTLEQLRNRRHAFLALPSEPVHERRVQRVDPAQEVGWLSVELKGKKYSLVITLGQDFWIGRHPDCDLILKEAMISNFHLRIYAVRTSCQQSLICVHDLSTNGFLLNGLEYKAGSVIKIGNAVHSPRTVILRPEDCITFTGTLAELAIHYHARHSQPTQTLAAGQVRCHIQPLFPSSDTSLYRTLENTWKVHNFTLGTGSFGRVHLATHAKRPVLQAACKTVGKQAQIEIEVQIISSITHPNVCGLYDMIKDEEEEDLVHLVMPLVTGGDLFSYMEKHQRLTEDEGKFAGLQISRAVEHLHSMGIAHRDIKPENILLHRSGAFPHLILADFGLATTRERVLAEVPSDRTQPLSRQPGFFGTVTYLPPERLKLVLSRKKTLGGMGESVHGGVMKWREEMGRKFFEEEKQLDIWAIGAVLYLILTGLHPYDNRNDPNASHDENEEMIHPFSQSQAKQDASYRKLSSARSWDAFRASNRLGTVGDGTDTEQEMEWRRVEEKCNRFLKLGTNHWRPAERWTEISVEGISLIAGLLHQHHVKRPTVSHALKHRWFTDQQDDLDAMYKTVVIDGKLGRSPVWKFNNGVPPRRRVISPPPPASIKPVLEQPKNPISSSKKTTQPTSSGKKRKTTSVAASSTSPTDTAKLKLKHKPKPKPKKLAVTPLISPAPTAVPLARRASSLFLPNSGIFGPLDDIAEADEDIDMADSDAEKQDAAMTLHDLINGEGTSSDNEKRQGSGASESTRVDIGEVVDMGVVEVESQPPIKAGKRKVQAAGKTKSKLALALDSQGIQTDDELRPSDLINTLNVGLPSLTTVGSTSNSKLSATGVQPSVRKSSFVPPVKIKKSRPGVVLARIGQTS